MSHPPVAVYVLQEKIDPETIGEIYFLIEASKSEAAVQLTLCPKVADADVIITNIRMRKRLERHLDWKIAQQKALVTPQWLRDTVQRKRIMECGSYAALNELQEETRKNCPDCDKPVCECKSSGSDPALRIVDALPQAPVVLDYKARYACQRPSPLVCPNQTLVDELSILRLHRHLEGKDINALAYERAIAVIKAYPRIITRDNLTREVSHLPSLGEKILYKIKEFLRDGVIAESQTIRFDERFQALKAFASIHGVGPSTARYIYSVGLRTLEDMERYYDIPTETEVKMGVDAIFTPNGRRVPPSSGLPSLSIRAALTLRRDLEQTIPRAEVEEIHATVMSVLQTIQPGCISTIVGGYRRGKPQSNDVDIVISHPTRPVKDLSKKLVQRLYELELVTNVAYQSGFHEHNALRTTHWDSLEKALTVFVLHPNGQLARVHRRIDLIFAQPQAYWTAVLGWTGSKMFERDLRLYAKVEKGMKFDSSGLTRRHDSKLYSPISEREIFDLLGLQWVDPILRNA